MSEIWKESGRYDDYGEEMLELRIVKVEKCLWSTNEEYMMYLELVLNL